jgi:hypothetical protein
MRRVWRMWSVGVKLGQWRMRIVLVGAWSTRVGVQARPIDQGFEVGLDSWETSSSAGRSCDWGIGAGSGTRDLPKGDVESDEEMEVEWGKLDMVA